MSSPDLSAGVNSESAPVRSQRPSSWLSMWNASTWIPSAASATKASWGRVNSPGTHAVFAQAILFIRMRICSCDQLLTDPMRLSTNVFITSRLMAVRGFSYFISDAGCNGIAPRPPPPPRDTNRHGKTTMEGWKAQSGLSQPQEQTIPIAP